MKVTNDAHEPRASEKMMIEEDDEPRESDDAIWDDVETLSASETKDARIHVTLRLDAGLYRTILERKKEKNDRTITATIERLLREGLDSELRGTNRELLRGLRDVIAHGAAQDAILVLLARSLHLDAEQERLFDGLQAHFAESNASRRWLAEPSDAGPESTARKELIEAIFNPIPLDPAS